MYRTPIVVVFIYGTTFTPPIHAFLELGPARVAVGRDEPDSDTRDFFFFRFFFSSRHFLWKANPVRLIGHSTEKGTSCGRTGTRGQSCKSIATSSAIVVNRARWRHHVNILMKFIDLLANIAAAAPSRWRYVGWVCTGRKGTVLRNVYYCMPCRRAFDGRG